MNVPLRYTKARSLHLACLKTPPTARGLATIGCRLSSHWILTFTSLAESSRTIVTTSIASPLLLNTIETRLWSYIVGPIDKLHMCQFGKVKMQGAQKGT